MLLNIQCCQLIGRTNLAPLVYHAIKLCPRVLMKLISIEHMLYYYSCQTFWCYKVSKGSNITVNDKSFTVCWAHQVCGEKFCNFFHYFLHTYMVYQLCKTATSVSTKILHYSREFSLKLSSAYSEMDKSTLLTHVWAYFSFPRWPCMQSQEEKSYSWSESRLLTASLLASSASYFLISWQKPSRFFATTVEYFPQIFQNFSWCKLSAE